MAEPWGEGGGEAAGSTVRVRRAHISGYCTLQADVGWDLGAGHEQKPVRKIEVIEIEQIKQRCG
jgi:hypothetical protein